MRDDSRNAWMMLAVEFGSRQGGWASLQDVIKAADYINHAPPLAQDLRGGLNRLIFGGLVELGVGGFRLSDAGTSLLAKVREQGEFWGHYKRLERDLSRLTDPEAPVWNPPTPEIDMASRSYLADMDDSIRRITGHRS